MATPPPPPNYAPTAGLSTTWWSQTAEAVWTPENIAAADQAHARLAASMDRLGLYITETPEQRARREREEDDAVRAKRDDETPQQRAKRHRAEDRRHRERQQRLASLPWRVPHGERARRFRRWCSLTALSASVGYAVHLVQWVAHLPYAVGIGALVAAVALDLRIRGAFSVPVSQVSGFRRVFVLVLVRVPVASALAAMVGLAPLLALTGHTHF